MVLSSVFPSELSVLSHHCHGSHTTVGGQCAKGKRDHLFKKYKQNRRPVDRKAHLKSKHLVNKMLKDAHNRYIEEILGITNPINHNDSNINPKTDTIPHTNTFATKNLYSLLENLKMDSKRLCTTETEWSIIYKHQRQSQHFNRSSHLKHH